MKKQTLLMLGGATFALLIVALFMQMPAGSGKGAAKRGERLLGDVNLKEIEKIVLEAGGQKTTIKKADDRYRVEEKEGYPADTGKVDALILEMLSLKGSEWVTSKKEKFGKLGVAGDSAGLKKVTFLSEGDKPLGGVLVGDEKKSRSGPGGSRYVRAEGSDHIFLADMRGFITAGPSSWLDKEILSIPKKDIKEVEVRHPKRRDGFVLKAGDDGEFDVTGTAKRKGKEPKAYIVGNAAGAISGLKLKDVLKRESGAVKDLDFDHSYVATLKDGRKYVIATAEKAGRKWLKVSVDYAEPKGGEGDEQKEGESDAAPENNSARELARAEQERFEGWIFEVGSLDNLRYKASDLYE